MDLAVEVPGSPLEAVMSHEVWKEIYDRLVELIESHRTTLITVNTRRLAERMAHQLSERLGAEYVAAHHGSLAKEVRLDAEHRLREGKLKVLVATASLELGIDIGHVDLVCQISSPHRIATFLQRVGRSGHTIKGVPKGRIFPLTRDDLIECAAMVRAVHDGELDRVSVPDKPLDVLAQQIVAEAAAEEEWDEDALLGLFRQAYPYRNLEKREFIEVVEMLARGYATRRGRRAALIHYDSLNHKLRARKGSRMTAIINGGAIPEVFDYRVVLEPEGHFIGTLNEDFAIESLPGDVFQLGNTSWRILRIGNGVVRVADAQGQPPSMPFWLGEAPARSDEMSAAVSRLRAAVDAELPGPEAPRSDGELEPAIDCSKRDYELSRSAAEQIAALSRRGQAQPRRRADRCDAIALERFFDESGGMQLVLHAPFGSRINRAWGLALRKKFCQGFNFELQAAATEEGMILSLGTLALVPAGGRVPLPAPEHRARDAGAGGPPVADLRDALALEHHARARRAAQPRRRARAEPAAAHVRRGPAAGGVPRRGRLPGQHPGRARDARPSAGRTRRCATALEEAVDLHGLERQLQRLYARRDPSRSRATRPSRRCSATSCSIPPSTRSSTTRRSRSAARAPSTRAAPPSCAAPTISARSIRRRSSACARKRGRSRTPPTRCTTR